MKHKAVRELNLGDIPVLVDHGIKTIWVDRMQVHLRSDTPLGMLSFSSLVPPDKLVEVCRLQTTEVHLKAIVDVLCRNLDYYPTKKSGDS